jgi:hypothetical protein
MECGDWRPFIVADIMPNITQKLARLFPMDWVGGGAPSRKTHPAKLAETATIAGSR